MADPDRIAAILALPEVRNVLVIAEGGEGDVSGSTAVRRGKMAVNSQGWSLGTMSPQTSDEDDRVDRILADHRAVAGLEPHSEQDKADAKAVERIFASAGYRPRKEAR
jgi:hypothetical protein